MRAYIGETLIHWGMSLASPSWSNNTLLKFRDFLHALHDDIGRKL